MFDKTNPLNSLAEQIENIFKSAIEDELIKIANATINTQRQPLNISSIANQNQYYIVLLFPRSSKLAFASESYGSVKKRKFRIDCFIVSQQDSLCFQLAGKIQTFVDKNENVFTAIGLKRPEIKQEFLKVADSKIYSSGNITGSLSCVASTIEGEIVI